jgi:hypothetical protein
MMEYMNKWTFSSKVLETFQPFNFPPLPNFAISINKLKKPGSRGLNILVAPRPSHARYDLYSLWVLAAIVLGKEHFSNFLFIFWSMPNASRPLISFDWAIKRLLRQKANYGILEGFLAELLRQDVTIVNIPESESKRDAEEDKMNKVDILLWYQFEPTDLRYHITIKNKPLRPSWRTKKENLNY